MKISPDENTARRLQVVSGSWPVARPGGGYVFSYEFAGGTWRIYIQSQPDYCGRASDGASTHRYGVGSRPYICWSKPLGSLREARAVAALWVECTEQYVLSGRFASLDGREGSKPGGTVRRLVKRVLALG
jgi:hypothetical protein